MKTPKTIEDKEPNRIRINKWSVFVTQEIGTDTIGYLFDEESNQIAGNVIFI